jgi:hypothetical protein
VSNPINGQNAAWSNPPSTSQWIWSEFDVNGNPLGQGTFVFRHDFTVPQYAYDFSFEFYGMADNLIVANPYWGGVGTDIAIVDQSSLNGDPAFIPNFVEYLSPAPSSMNPNIMNHFNAGTGQTQIPPASSVQAWTLSQETDVSLVVTAHNQMLQAPGFPPTATDGGLAYTLNVSYCDPGLPDDPPPLPVDDDDDDCECSNASVDSEADGLPGFTTPLVLCGLMLAAIVSNRRREIERVTKKIVKRISR